MSQGVLVEVGRNLHSSASPEAQERFRSDLATIAWTLVPSPDEALIQQFLQLIRQKDAHVLAAAITTHCEFLLTLDRRDFFTTTLQEAALPIEIVTPGDFIQRYYRLHPNYASLPRVRGD